MKRPGGEPIELPLLVDALFGLIDATSKEGAAGLKGSCPARLTAETSTARVAR
jgi:hypothetical protein